MKLLMIVVILGGCAERDELRGQQCAQIAIKEHGVTGPTGVYGTWINGRKCWSHLRDGERVYEGPLSDKWRPE